MVSDDTTFFEEFCRHSYWMKVIFGLSLLFFLLHLPYPLVVEPGTALYVVATMNIVGTAVFMLASGYTVRKCQTLE